MSFLEYEFLPRTPELIAHRRVHLDRYANLAQLSQVAIHLLLLSYNLVLSTSARKHAEKSPKDNPSALGRIANVINSRLGTELSRGYGTYGQWLFGLVWTAWLGFLCFAETTPDYLHLTKRFGLIAASQMPIHYLLAMPQSFSPLRLLFKSPRSLTMSVHKVTGKIIIAFFAAHVVLYSNNFVQMGIFWKTIWLPKFVVAVISAGIFLAIGITSIGSFRRSKYWWFYRVHVVGSVAILPLLYFHVSSIRLYLFESAIVVIANALFRSIIARSN